MTILYITVLCVFVGTITYSVYETIHSVTSAK